MQIIFCTQNRETKMIILVLKTVSWVHRVNFSVLFFNFIQFTKHGIVQCDFAANLCSFYTGFYSTWFFLTSAHTASYLLQSTQQYHIFKLNFNQKTKLMRAKSINFM